MLEKFSVRWIENLWSTEILHTVLWRYQIVCWDLLDNLQFTRNFLGKVRYSDLILLISIYYYYIYLLSPIMIYSPTCSGLSSLRNYCDFCFTNKWPAEFVWKFRPRILFQFSINEARPGNGRYNFAFGDRKWQQFFRFRFKKQRWRGQHHCQIDWKCDARSCRWRKICVRKLYII